MAKSEWGMKRTCQDCGAPFYDLKKKNIVCPKCGAAFIHAPAAKPKRMAPVEKPAPKPVAVEEKTLPPAKVDGAGDVAGDGAKAAAGKDGKDKSPEGEVNTEALDDGGDDDDKDLIEDTSDLSHDDDDISEVKDHIDDGVQDKN